MECVATYAMKFGGRARGASIVSHAGTMKPVDR